MTALVGSYVSVDGVLTIVPPDDSNAKSKRPEFVSKTLTHPLIKITLSFSTFLIKDSIYSGSGALFVSK